MKHNYNNKKYLNRQELQEAHKNRQSYQDEDLSLFSRRALKGMQYLDDDSSLDSILNKIDQNIDQQSKQRRAKRLVLRYSAVAAAATVALLLISSLFINGSSEQDLFAAYFEPLPSAVINTGLNRGAVDKAELKSLAYKAYELANFPEAISKFKEYLKTEPEDLETNFYLGIALLGEGYSAEATERLSVVQQNPPREAYKDLANWYLALAYVQSDRSKAAIPLLQSLVEESEDHRENAARLLKDLN